MNCTSKYSQIKKKNGVHFELQSNRMWLFKNKLYHKVDGCSLTNLQLTHDCCIYGSLDYSFQIDSTEHCPSYRGHGTPSTIFLGLLGTSNPCLFRYQIDTFLLNRILQKLLSFAALYWAFLMHSWQYPSLSWIWRISAIKITSLPKALYSVCYQWECPLQNQILFIWAQKHPSVPRSILYVHGLQDGLGVPNVLQYYTVAHISPLAMLHVLSVSNTDLALAPPFFEPHDVA